jgi:hypothetical protein
MPNPHLEALTRHFPAIIDVMDNEFDSHEFILELARTHPVLYVEALHAYRDKGAPFETLHRVLAVQLRGFDDRVEGLGKVKSKNIFREETPCERWRKLPVI